MRSSVAICKKDFFIFKKGNKYTINGTHSIFQKDDYITILGGDGSYIRFTLNKFRTMSVEDYFGETEDYFYDYFYSPQEMRKIKLNKINGTT